jgi:hypothetical protein
LPLLLSESTRDNHEDRWANVLEGLSTTVLEILTIVDSQGRHNVRIDLETGIAALPDGHADQFNDIVYSQSMMNKTFDSDDGKVAFSPVRNDASDPALRNPDTNSCTSGQRHGSLTFGILRAFGHWDGICHLAVARLPALARPPNSGWNGMTREQ